MSKYKICVYAICKNEEKHINRWYESMKEADDIFVLDTGSTDNSVNLLKKLNINVLTKIINPFRFDVARNESLNMVPEYYDYCVCTDLDEVFDKGWRKELENILDDNITRVKYRLNFSFDKYNNPDTVLYISKIHKRKGFKWVNIIHEYLENEYEDNIVYSDKIILNHYPDITKSRSSYIKLLEESIKIDKDDERNFYYLGREYYYYKNYKKAVDIFHKYLYHKNCFWNVEKSDAMRLMARCYENIKYYDEAIYWYKESINTYKSRRESFVDLGYLYYRLNDYNNSYYYLKKAYKIKEKDKSFVNEGYAWALFFLELLSAVCYKLKKYNESLKYLYLCKKISSEGRHMENIKIIKRLANSSKQHE